MRWKKECRKAEAEARGMREVAAKRKMKPRQLEVRFYEGEALASHSHSNSNSFSTRVVERASSHVPRMYLRRAAKATCEVQGSQPSQRYYFNCVPLSYPAPAPWPLEISWPKPKPSEELARKWSSKNRGAARVLAGEKKPHGGYRAQIPMSC